MPRPKGKKNQAVETTKNETVIATVSDLNREKVANSIAKTQVDIAKALGDLSSRLTQEFGTLESVQSAIDLKKNELETLREIEVTATTLDDLRAMIESTRESWTLEDQERITARNRENADYVYRRDLERSREEDRYNNEMEAKRREWEEKDAEYAARAAELESYKKQVAEFPSILEKEVKKAESIVGNTMKRDFETQNKIAAAEREAEKKLLEQKVQNQESMIAELNRQIQVLNQKYDKALEDTKAISTAALNSFSGKQTVDALQRVAESSVAPTQPRSK